MRNLDWQKDAACADLDREIFFPEKHDPGVYTEARRICFRCPVKNACLDMAMEMEGSRTYNDRHGMFGGLTPRERYSRRRRKAA